MIWIPTNIILHIFGRFEIYGLENLKEAKKPVIFACNHSSELDPVPLPAALPFWSRFSPIFYASREKAFYDTSGWRQLFYGGFLFRAWGAYPVYVGLKNYEKSLKHQTDIMRDGGCICVYPEGGATPDGTIQPAKGGVAYLAHATGATIVPVRISGTFHLTWKAFFLRRTNISVRFGKPLPPLSVRNADLSIDEFKKYANYVMSEVGKL
jgi:1-acyl-sn-glycerol-3-phosphate acyltransferase